MFFLKRTKDKLDIELSGELEVKTPRLDDYEAWCKEQEKKALQEEVYHLLLKIAKPGDLDTASAVSYYSYSGKVDACETIAKYLVNKAL